MESLQKNKTCTKCNVTLEANNFNFYKDKSKKDGLSSSCSNCCRKTKSNTYKNITSIKLKKERDDKRHAYINSNEYRLKIEISKQKEKEAKKRYRDKNRELLNQKQRVSNRKPITKEKRKQYKQKEYEKIMSCPFKKLIHYSRVRVNDIIKNRNKSFSISGLVFFTKNDLVLHLESKFKDGMTWDNYGRKGWHIDHIKPLVLFDLTKEEEIKEAFALTNLQPLFESENCSKGSLYNGVRHLKNKTHNTQ